MHNMTLWANVFEAKVTLGTLFDVIQILSESSRMEDQKCQKTRGKIVPICNLDNHPNVNQLHYFLVYVFVRVSSFHGQKYPSVPHADGFCML